MTVNCSNGFLLSAKDSNLIVQTKKSSETIPIAHIQSFTLKEPRGLSMGTISFATARAATTGLNLGFGVSASMGAERNFFFGKAELSSALQLQRYIANFDPNTKTQTGTVVSVVDEIRGLKALLDDGILTQEEFDAKKKQLLNI